MSWISERIEMIKKKIVLGRALFAITCKNKHLPNELDKIIKNKIAIVNNSIKREANFFHELQYYEILKIEYGIDIQELKNIYEEQISYLYDLEDLLNKNQFSFGYKEKMQETIKKLLNDAETYLNELYHLKSLS